MDIREQIDRMHDAVAEVAGCELPAKLKAELDAASLAVGTIEHLAVRDGKKDWRWALGVHLGYTLEGIAVANYHIGRVAQIEEEIATAIASLESPPRASNIGFSSRKLNAEYQAFVLALRRAVEYFAAAVATYFKADCYRVRRVVGAIERHQPADRRVAVTALLETRLAQIPDLLSAGNDHSVRDDITHYRYVFAATFTAGWDAHGNLEMMGIVGGPEDLPHPPDPTQTLSSALRAQFDQVTAMIVDTYRELGLLPFD